MSSPLASPSSLFPAVSLFQGPEVHSYAWAGVALLLGLVIYTSTRSKGPYDAIPAFGNTGFLSSYLSAIQFLKNGNTILSEGYNKYKTGIYRIPEINRWHILVNGEKLTEELRKAPDEVLSFVDAVKDDLASDYTLGRNIIIDPYHIGIIRATLTRNLGVLFPAVRDEIVLAFDDCIPATDEWTKVRALETVAKIVARTSNRIFIGAPLCRDPEWVALNIQFTMDAVIAGHIINLFPTFLKPLAGRLFTKVPQKIQVGLKHLRPIIEERQRKIDEYGLSYPDKPNDLLSWLMDEAKPEERSARNLTLRVLSVNFAAIHTSSMSFTHALFSLASRPEYIQPIRDEVEAVIAEDGWNKVAMTRMRKLDSFLKESARFDSIGAVSLIRKALQDFTFSDGTRIPKGGYVSTSTGRHRDDAVYPRSDVFAGFRFSDMRDEDGQGTKNQMVATSPDYLTFGHGRHSCPGRFFAANELKAMMAHVVVTYDIKMAHEGVRPENTWYGPNCIPDSKAEVLFRKRQT